MSTLFQVLPTQEPDEPKKGSSGSCVDRYANRLVLRDLCSFGIALLAGRARISPQRARLPDLRACKILKIHNLCCIIVARPERDPAVMAAICPTDCISPMICYTLTSLRTARPN